MNKICGIYKITNKINGKIYIGQSIDIYKRWAKEKKGYVNDYLKNAFLRYGLENFTFEIIEECSIEELDEKEIYYISFYKSNEHDFGYNLTRGGKAFKEKVPWNKNKKGLQTPWNKGKKGVQTAWNKGKNQKECESVKKFQKRNTRKSNV